MGMPPRERSDLIVVGAGAAGLYAALTAARVGARVTLISAAPLAESSSYWAQGGLAAALAADDSPALHLEDTLKAGRGATRESAARVLCAEAAMVLKELTDLGVAWDRDRHGRPSLGLEGGHSARRIVHAGGAATGRRITRALSADAAESPLIEIVEGTRVESLLLDSSRCRGVVLADGTTFESRATLLATGGASALWKRTTNPLPTIGRGLVIAHAAGAALADLEMVQFHPTALAAGTDRDGLLVTEAIRGEGALLVDADGQRFVDELAPRDEVATAIYERMLESNSPSVALDMRSVDPRLFPNVVASLEECGLDPRTDLIPVAPAAHYVMGGIETDLQGQSTLPGLFAIGESACTGLHGANRLASNSLTECFVFGRRSALASLDSQASDQSPASAVRAPGPVMPTAETRSALWANAGLVRNKEGLERLLDDPHPLARMVAACALAREETRGAHRRSDFPDTNPALDGCRTALDAAGTARVIAWNQAPPSAREIVV